MGIMPTVDVGDFVNVQVNISPIAVPFSLFGVPLVLGDSGVIDTTTRVRTYSTITEVGADFGNTSPEYLAAEVFFEQSPQPSTCMIGAWAASAIGGAIEGGSLSATQQQLANFTAITAGNMLIWIDGVPYNVSGVNFSAALNLNGVAATLQTALRAVGGSATAAVKCVWDPEFERFEITSGTTGVTSSVSFASVTTAIDSVAFSGQPTAGTDSLTVNGTQVNFVSSLTSGIQCLEGSNLAGTLANLVALLNSSTDTNISKGTYYVVGTTLYMVSIATGTAGNSYTLAKSGSTMTLGSSTWLGGLSTGTPLGPVLGLLSTSGGYLVPGLAAESLLSAVQACANVSNQWYGLYVASTAVPQVSDYTAVAAYILASTRSRIFGVTIQNPACLNSAITNGLADVLQSFNNKRVFWHYSSSNPYAAMTLMGRAFTVNFLGSLTTLTLAWKQAPGIAAEYLNESQFAALQAKSGNVVIAIDNGAQMIWPGQMSNGNPIGPVNGFWFDEVHGVDWFANYIQTNVFNFMYTVQTKVPQDDDGTNQLMNNIEASCVQAVNNGLVAPGIWTGAGFGALTTNTQLSKGWYVYAPAIATQSQAAREARQSVPIQVAAKLAGAVHTVDVILNINR